MSFEKVEHALHKRRKSRNIGLGAVLIGFVALVFVLTIAKVVDEGDAQRAEQSQRINPPKASE